MTPGEPNPLPRKLPNAWGGSWPKTLLQPIVIEGFFEQVLPPRHGVVGSLPGLDGFTAFAGDYFLTAL
jgi:hypothetical protein